MGIFRRSKRLALGIDIGSASVKVLELSTAGKGFKASRAGVEPLPKNAIVEHRINDLRLISDAVRRAVHHSRSSRKRVVVSVPQTHVITRTINLPAGLAEREIEEQVMIEAAQQIPHSLDEVNLSPSNLLRAFDLQRLGARYRFRNRLFL